MYEFLKKLCEERNTNISKLCTEVTGNSGNLATWKKGYMRSDYLSKCADVLGVSADYILQRGSSKDAEYEKLVSVMRKLNDEQISNLAQYIEFLYIKQNESEQGQMAADEPTATSIRRKISI